MDGKMLARLGAVVFVAVAITATATSSSTTVLGSLSLSYICLIIGMPRRDGRQKSN